MSVAVNQRWPNGLRERVAAVAGERGVTRFTVEALEAALGEPSVRTSVEKPGTPGVGGASPVAGPVSPRASEPAAEFERKNAEWDERVEEKVARLAPKEPASWKDHPVFGKGKG